MKFKEMDKKKKRIILTITGVLLIVFIIGGGLLYRSYRNNEDQEQASNDIEDNDISNEESDDSTDSSEPVEEDKKEEVEQPVDGGETTEIPSTGGNNNTVSKPDSKPSTGGSGSSSTGGGSKPSTGGGSSSGSNGGGSSSGGSNNGGSNNGSSGSNGEGTVTPPPVDNSYKGFSYNLSTDGRQSMMFGGDTNATRNNPTVSSKSTISGFSSEIDKAISYLTQGAYESKVKAQFVGKVWNGMTIADAKVEHFKHKKGISIEERQDFINNILPGGLGYSKFVSAANTYSTPDSDGYTCYIRFTVIFK